MNGRQQIATSHQNGSQGKWMRYYGFQFGSNNYEA